MSERCERTTERMSEWPSTLRVDFIVILPIVGRDEIGAQATATPKRDLIPTVPHYLLKSGARILC